MDTAPAGEERRPSPWAFERFMRSGQVWIVNWSLNQSLFWDIAKLWLVEKNNI